jgi:leucyl-tRNA synthetase
MIKEYIPNEIEKLSQEYWIKNKSFKLKKINTANKYYCLSMFPYPSGKLHMGHIRNYTIGDIISRYKKICGYDVFNPIGWDAFGIPAENAARDNNISPNTWIKKNIKDMRIQLKALGFGFDWDREVNTSNYKYYKWEQMFFIKLFYSGLVYKKNTFVNWDPIDKTVLANEQVIEGRGWRSNALVERKKIPQWYIKITKYAGLLFDDLEKLINWPQKVKDMQKNWINKRLGYNISFNTKKNNKLDLFFENIYKITNVFFFQISNENFDLIKNESTFFFNNSKNFILINPINKKENVLFINENTDECLKIFNEKNNLNIDLSDIEILTNNYFKIIISKKNCSNKLNFLFKNLNNENKNFLIFFILNKYEKIKIDTEYSLKDWCISRQRYWGVPIPMIYCKKCGIIPEKIDNLPIKLPNVKQKNYKNILLSNNKIFTNIKCNICNESAKRETDTFDTFFESSWYYAKYLCNNNLNSNYLNKWLPIDQYIGGIEHANLHLIYARFFCKVMKDFNILNCDEPFTNLLTQGMVLMNGSKMSKSKGNIIDQNQIISKYGADTLRLFIMFVAPPEQSFEWNDNGIIGCKKFLDKVWNLSKKISNLNENIDYFIKDSNLNETHLLIIKIYNECLIRIKLIVEKKFTFNVVIATLMKLTNLIFKMDLTEKIDKIIFNTIAESIIILLSPFSPHITHFIWSHILKKEKIILNECFPNIINIESNEKTFTNISVYINGKFKKNIDIDKNIKSDELIKLITTHSDLSKFFNKKIIKNFFYKESKLINILIQ